MYVVASLILLPSLLHCIVEVEEGGVHLQPLLAAQSHKCILRHCDQVAVLFQTHHTGFWHVHLNKIWCLLAKATTCHLFIGLRTYTHCLTFAESWTLSEELIPCPLVFTLPSRFFLLSSKQSRKSAEALLLTVFPRLATS